MRAPSIALLAGLFLVSVAAPALAAEGGSEQSLIVLSGTAYVATNESVGTVVVFRGSAVVLGTVRKSLIAFDAPVLISGVVEGDVVSFRGKVELTAGAHVLGDIFARKVTLSTGAVLDGKVRPVSAYPVNLPVRALTRFALWLAVSISTLGLGLLMLWLGRRALDATSEAARTHVGASVGWGIGTFILLPLAAILLLVTLVGIPLGLGLLLALVLVYSMGYVASAWILGRIVMRSAAGGFMAYLAGWAILRAVALIPGVGGFSWFAATVFGLGAISVAIWRARQPVPALAQPVPPPPPGP